MKILFLSVALVLAACVECQDMMTIVMKCKDSVGASGDDMAKLMTFTPPENQKQKCLFSCVMAGINIVKDGKLVKEGFMEAAKPLVGGDPELMKQAAELFEECSALTDADPCEASVKIGFCLKTSGAKRKLMFEF